MKKNKDIFWSIWITILIVITIIAGMHKHITSFVNLPDNIDRIVLIIVIVGIVVVEIVCLISRISHFIKDYKSNKK